jgi:hypothetical protein
METSSDHGLSAAEQWLEVEAIKQLKARCFRLMDTKEWLPFSQVFTDDVVVGVSHDKHVPGDTIRGRANVVDFIRGYGHYHEAYRKEGGKWLISTLKLTRLRVDSLG